MKRKLTSFYLDEREREILDRLAAKWGTGLGATIRRIVLEYGEKENG